MCFISYESNIVFTIRKITGGKILSATNKTCMRMVKEKKKMGRNIIRNGEKDYDK